MHVVYHERYEEVYTSDPAAATGRIECIKATLENCIEFIKPKAASEADLLSVHSQSHVDWVKQQNLTYEVAVLAVGGALKASEFAMKKESAFGLIRPPGHHASPNSSWGFCYFNNIAIAVERLRKEGNAARALIVDIDLHYGDGTANSFMSVPEVDYHHVQGNTRERYLSDLRNILNSQEDCDFIALSAGFDRHELDWGGLLKTEDYQTIGRMIKKYVDEKCDGKVFAVLEGGYNHSVLGESVKALLLGLK